MAPTLESRRVGESWRHVPARAVYCMELPAREGISGGGSQRRTWGDVARTLEILNTVVAGIAEVFAAGGVSFKGGGN